MNSKVIDSCLYTIGVLHYFAGNTFKANFIHALLVNVRGHDVSPVILSAVRSDPGFLTLKLRSQDDV